MGFAGGIAAIAIQPRRRGWIAIVEGSAVEQILDGLCRRESQLLGRCDLDGRAGCWIAAFTGRAVLHLELAKAIEADFLTFGSAFRNGGEHQVDDLLGVRLGRSGVGRTLRQLMKDKRVGRGQYRKAEPGKRPAITETIGAAIARKVRRSKRNVFLRSDFAPLGSYDAVGRALRQKATEGQLVQIGYGLYAKAEVSPFTGNTNLH